MGPEDRKDEPEDVTEFKVGDKVRAPTIAQGVGVVEVRDELSELPIFVNFPSGGAWFFTSDGKFYVHAEEPALILVERPKAKRKVKVERWVNLYKSPDNPSGVSCRLCYSESEAAWNAQANSTFIKTVKFETEVEIEE